MNLTIQIPKQKYTNDLKLMSPIQTLHHFSKGENKQFFYTENENLIYTHHINQFELHIYSLFQNLKIKTSFKIPNVKKSKYGGYYVQKINVKHHLKITDTFYFNDARTKYIQNVIPNELKENVIIAIAQFLAIAHHFGIQFLEFECLIDDKNEIYMIDFEKAHYSKNKWLPKFEKPFYILEKENDDYEKMFSEKFLEIKNQL